VIMSSDSRNIRLSICIATYNRAKYISETLDSIISQVNDDVEILVVDGASNDNTREIVEGYERLCPQLRYVRLPVKGGVDEDYAKAVELASGGYCWLMTDDDVLKDGAVKKVLNAIDKKYGLIIVNAEVRDIELKTLIEERRLKFNVDRIYKLADHHQFFVEMLDYLTFIGCVVIKKRLWNERDKAKYFGSLFIHVGVIFQEPIREDVLVIADPLISIRYANAQWKAREFEIWMFKWPNLVRSFTSYSDSDKSKSKAYSREAWKKLKMLVLYRGTGAYTKKEYDKWIKSRIRFGFKKLCSKMIAFVPCCLANLFCVVYLTVLRKDSKLTLVDLKSSSYYLLHCDSRTEV